MKLPKEKYLKRSKHSQELEQLLDIAQKAMDTWDSIWTKFIPAPLREEAIKIFQEIEDIAYTSTGGFPQAERQRILISRKRQEKLLFEENPPISAIKIVGNFLFDRTSTSDFTQVLSKMGIRSEDIGDIWISGDRGAQAICTPEASISLANQNGLIRDVEICCKAIDLEELRIPFQRIPKRITSVEASKRLDAIASAGFGISRSKISQKLKAGKLRLNWCSAKTLSKEITVGDQIQLEDKGNIKILSLELTKRGRWRVELIRE